MWICLNNAFLSAVAKDCAADELLVRARVKNHITNVFPDAKVKTSDNTDYRFRAVVKRDAIAKALADQVKCIQYPNFKDSVRDDNLHSAYSRVWSAMYTLQSKGGNSRWNFL